LLGRLQVIGKCLVGQEVGVGVVVCMFLEVVVVPLLLLAGV